MTERISKGLERDKFNINPSQRSSATLDTSAPAKDTSIE